MDNFLKLMMIIGTLVPWYFFISFMQVNGIDLSIFIGGLFANGAAAGFTADLLITSSVFWVWSFVDSQQNHASKYWLLIPIATMSVGLSLAVPLYLWLRGRPQHAG